ncbi:MAG: hypothetical protein GY815_09445 [Gammaproteobacteria bacterium]|nr:hypothetical protein [Gammaproteobacteria bacterium]
MTESARPAGPHISPIPRSLHPREKTTAKQWGKDLNLFYTPTIVPLSPEGEEVMRIVSVVQFYRPWGVLDYVDRQIYRKGIDYQGWRPQRRDMAE